MKRAILVLSLMLASSVPAFAWTCLSVNSAGVPFYGNGFYEFQAARNAMAACQLSTPWGLACTVTSCY